jgi:hypothetical protein
MVKDKGRRVVMQFMSSGVRGKVHTSVHLLPSLMYVLTEGQHIYLDSNIWGENSGNIQKYSESDSKDY